VDLCVPRRLAFYDFFLLRHKASGLEKLLLESAAREESDPGVSIDGN